jgi:septal ring factor EnvC (AmiA/AmiB activator)
MSAAVTAPVSRQRLAALGAKVATLSTTCEDLERDRDAAARTLREVDAARATADRELEKARRQRDEARQAHHQTIKELMTPMSPTAPKTAQRPLAVQRKDAAALLSVSVDFFDKHIVHELRCVRRGRSRLFAVAELERWLEREAERVTYP